MPYLYFDTSALVKHYVREPGSVWVSSLIDDRTNVIFASDLAIAEVSAAFAILNRTSRITRHVLHQALTHFYQDATRRYQLVAATRAIAFRAAELAQQYPLKGYDAVHLASGLSQDQFLRRHSEVITFVSGDAQTLTAARAEGLIIDSPFDHIHLDGHP